MRTKKKRSGEGRGQKRPGDNLEVMEPEETGGDVIKDSGVSALERIVLFKIKVVCEDTERCGCTGKGRWRSSFR